MGPDQVLEIPKRPERRVRPRFFVVANGPVGDDTGDVRVIGVRQGSLARTIVVIDRVHRCDRRALAETFDDDPLVSQTDQIIHAQSRIAQRIFVESATATFGPAIVNAVRYNVVAFFPATLA